MKKILFIFTLILPLFALDIEKLILVNRSAKELDLAENTLWFEFTKNGNRCVMYNSKEDLAGFQFNFKDLKQTYGDGKITFRNGQTEKEDFTLKYNDNTGIILGFSIEGHTLPAGIDTLFEIIPEKIPYKTLSEETENTKKVELPENTLNGCELPENTFALSENNIIYNSKHDIGGFQFSIKDALINKAFGGDAEKSGFTTSSGKNIILSFSFEGNIIPAGCGVLLSLDTDKKPTEIDNIVVSSIKGKTLSFEFYKQ